MGASCPALVDKWYFLACEDLAAAAPLFAVVEALVEFVDLTLRVACLVGALDPAVGCHSCSLASQQLAIVAPFVTKVSAWFELIQLTFAAAGNCGGCEPEGCDDGDGEMHFGVENRE